MTCHAIPSNSYGHFKNSAPSSANQNILEFIKNLSPEEKNQFIENLSQKENENSLKAFAEYISPSEYNRASSLSVDEKKELFKEFAKDLNADQLARFSLQFSKKSDIQLLSQTIADHSSPEAKIGFIKAIAPESTIEDIEVIQSRASESFYYNDCNAALGHDKQAEAIIKVLGSFENGSKYFDTAIKSLSSNQIKAVIDAGIDWEEKPDPEFGFETIKNPNQLNRIIKAASHSNDIDTKSKIFISVTNKLDKIYNIDSGSVTNELIKLVDSDTRGIVNVLRDLGGERLAGEPLSKYVEYVMKEDPETGSQALGRQLAKMKGWGTGKTPYEYFYEESPSRSGKDHYHNADDLGLFVGSVMKGLNNMATDVNKRREQMINILFSAATVGIPSPGSGFVANIAKEIIDETIDGIKKGVVSKLDFDNLKNLERQFYREATPPGYRGDEPADTVFENAINNVHPIKP